MKVPDQLDSSGVDFKVSRIHPVRMVGLGGRFPATSKPGLRELYWYREAVPKVCPDQKFWRAFDFLSSRSSGNIYNHDVSLILFASITLREVLYRIQCFHPLDTMAGR